MSLAKSFKDKVKIHDLEKVLEPLFSYWKMKSLHGESFGDFTNRLVRIINILEFAYIHYFLSGDL